MTANFDRELGLDELLKGLSLERLHASLQTLAAIPLALEDTDGRILAGHAFTPEDGAEKVPFLLEIEPLGYVRVAHGAPRAGAAAASLLQLILQARAQVVRAGDLHSEAMSADYEQLRVQNEALRASETRYRELSEELEQRVQAQVQLLDERQRQLYQAERLASVGQLAAGVAHEINNPIGYIRSNLETGRSYLDKFRQLQQALPHSSEIAAAWQQCDLDFVLEDFGELLADCVAGADRVARIVKDLKGFSNVDQAEEENVDLNEQLDTVVSVVSGQKPPGIGIVTQYQPLPRLLCLPGLLNQVFVNLLANAMQALDGRENGGEIRITTRLQDEHVVVEIADNGCGIDSAVLPRIFDPFFTTRAVGKGSGLGLTVARDIVAAHGGSIDVRSALEQGTTVSIFLPL